jgi:starch-binding outer membrane protein, SusD/RagB family
MDREMTSNSCKRTDSRRRRRARQLGRAIFSALILPVMLVACDDLLTVEVPGAASEADLDNPGLARTLVVAALGEFECSFVQYAATAGILTREFESASGFRATNIWNSRLESLDEVMGSCPGSRTADGFGYWAPMQTARFLADDAYERLTAFPSDQVPNLERKLGDVSTYGGFSYLLLGEGYCEMAADGGPLLSRQDVFGIAENRFTQGIGHAQAAGDNNLLQAAHVGRARARLYQGDLAGAASDARQVSEGFVRDVNFTSTQVRRENRWVNLTYTVERLTVGPDYLDLTVNGEPDVRVPVEDTGGPGEDAVTHFYQQQKYTSHGQNIPLASWVEAQLIIAEAEGGSSAVEALNNVRAHFGLPAYTGDGSLEDVIEERRRTFFMEGQRLNDMLRFDIPFPSGTNNKGDPYGPTTCIPLPLNERLNNPNIPN